MDPATIRKYAVDGLRLQISEKRVELERMESDLDALERGVSAMPSVNTATPRRRGRPAGSGAGVSNRSEESRRQQSEAMRRKWAERKAAKQAQETVASPPPLQAMDAMPPTDISDFIGGESVEPAGNEAPGDAPDSSDPSAPHGRLRRRK